VATDRRVLAARGHQVFWVRPAKASDLRKFFSQHTKTNGIDPDTLARLGLVDRTGLIYLRLADTAPARLDRAGSGPVIA
jgi:hypothetical protein